MDVCAKVAEYKIETGKKVFDKVRECEKLNTVKDMTHNDFNRHGVEELFEQVFGEKEVILFGEGYGSKIQGVGGLYRSDVSFILFDVLIGDNYQPRDRVEDVAKMFDLEIVPIVLTGTLDEAIQFVRENPKSTIGTAMMEGVVGRPLVEMRDRCGNRVIVKIKYKDFKEFA